MIVMKFYYDVRLYKERRRKKGGGLINFLASKYMLLILFPVAHRGETERQQQLVKKANLYIYLFYSILVLALVIQYINNHEAY